MFDKFSMALTLMREAFEDAQTGAEYLPCVDLAAEVDGAQAALITCWAPSTSAARSTHGRYSAPVWASSKASRISVSASENLSNMCSSVRGPTDNCKPYPQRKSLQH